MERKENSHKIVFLGVGLIIFVMAFTVIRPHIFTKKTNNILPENNIQETQKKDAGNEISGEELWKKINNKENIVIIDTRDADSFNLSHIIDAKNYTMDEFVKGAGGMNKQAQYFFIDESGDAAMNEVVKIAKSAGLDNSRFLTGGMSGWRNESRPAMTDADPTSFVDQAKVQYINCDDLKAGLGQKKAVIIDLRKPAAYAEGHIKDSVNIYLGELEQRRSEIPIDKQIILVDNDGLWAYKGAVKLFDMGFLNTLALTEGLDKWKEKEFEIVK